MSHYRRSRAYQKRYQRRQILYQIRNNNDTPRRIVNLPQQNIVDNSLASQFFNGSPFY
jgi:hypothetical protein